METQQHCKPCGRVPRRRQERREHGEQKRDRRGEDLAEQGAIQLAQTHHLRTLPRRVAGSAISLEMRRENDAL
jgi:hypothetical protein